MAMTNIQLRNQSFIEQYFKNSTAGKSAKTSEINSRNLTEVGTYRPGGFKYVPLDESKVVNKSEPEMSDEEFEEAIRKMATEDATKDLEKGKDCFDNFQKSDKFSSMLKSYVSVVSPDRIGIIKGTLAQNGGVMRNSKFYAPNGELCATYNTRENVWLTNVMTGDEKSRMKKYVQLYNDTYNAVKNPPEEQ